MPTNSLTHRLDPRRRRARVVDLAPLSFLFDDYKCSRWAFDVFDMWRRITMIGLIPFFPLTSRPIIGCGLAALSIVIFQVAEPYHDPATNTL